MTDLVVSCGFNEPSTTALLFLTIKETSNACWLESTKVKCLQFLNREVLVKQGFITNLIK